MRHSRNIRPMAARPSVRIALAVCAIATAWLGGTPQIVAAENQPLSDNDRFQAYVDAGEWSLARQMADQSTDSRQRDGWLADLAANQARHGATAQSVETASYIYSDKTRSSTLGSLNGGSSGGFLGSGTGRGGRGGGVVADYDPLMELIENTIAPESWEAVGGPGTMSPFVSGVHVDPSGTLKRINTLGGETLSALREDASRRLDNRDVRVASRLRKVSLTRLEKEAQLLRAQGKPLTPEMMHLAGIRKIEYVFVYPETGDIVIAGPAGEWTWDGDARPISVETGAPVLNLDDLVVCLRNAYENDGVFGCSIDPRAENLAATQRFLSESRLTGARWREAFRESLGLQDITVNGLDPRTRAAHVIVEADYRMKLIGMGVEDGVLGVESYLHMVQLDENGNPPPMDVVRWWFAMNYDALTATEDRNGFQLNGQGVKVLSESEFLSDEGEREGSGTSTLPTHRFAESFTKEFESLAERYPIYAELRNVFDLALVASLIRSEKLDQQVDWNLTFFGSPTTANDQAYEVALAEAPTQVETVMNHRTINGRKNGRRVRHTIVGVSGGVKGDTRAYVSANAIDTDEYGLMKAERKVAVPEQLDHHQWWWD